MRYIITTLGRPWAQRTFDNLPPSIQDRVEVWVQTHEWDVYHEVYEEGVRELPYWVTRLGQTREHLVRRYWGEKIVLMDDDLEFYWRPNHPDWHLRTPPPEQLERMFQEIELALESFAHVGVSGREGQHRGEGYADTCTRYMRLLCYNTALWPDHVHCDRVDGVSDFDTALQLLRAGLPSLVFNKWAQGQRATQQPGGCAVYRDHDFHSADVRRLAELHPGLVEVVKKQNISGGAFGTRDESVVQWKQALGWDFRNGERFVESSDSTERELCMGAGDEPADGGGRAGGDPERPSAGLPRAGHDGVHETMGAGAVLPGP